MAHNAAAGIGQDAVIDGTERKYVLQMRETVTDSHDLNPSQSSPAGHRVRTDSQFLKGRL